MPSLGGNQAAAGSSDTGILLRDLKGDRLRADRFKRWFMQSHDTFQEWRRKAIESYEFVSGKQWSDADLEKMQRQKRPALVINKVLGPIQFLSGVQRQQRQEPKILPFESTDVRPAELMGVLLKWVGMVSREPVIDSHVFQDKIITGLGFWKCIVEFDDADKPEGEILWQRVSPLSVYPDPQFLDEGWNKANYCIHAVWMKHEDAVARWPDKKTQIERQVGEWLSGTSSGSNALFGGGHDSGDSLADWRLFWDKDTQMVRVLEVWYRETAIVDVAINNEDGQITTDPQRVRLLRELVKATPGAEEQITFTRRPVKRMRLAHVLDEILLDDEDSPYEAKEFPLFPTVGFYWWRQPLGLVEIMKDPQREKNVRRSTMVDMVRRSAHSGWYNRRNGGAKTKELEDFANGNGVVINFESERPEQLRPPELPQTLVFLEGRSDQEIRDVVNINNELLGNTTQRTISGRAIEARQRSGLTVQEPLLESFEQDKEPAVRFMIRLIQQFMPISQATRVLGAFLARQPATPQASVIENIQAEGQMELERVLSEAFSTEFDVVIDSRSFEPSINQQRWQVLLELATNFPGQIPPNVLIDAAKDAGLVGDADAEQIRSHVQKQEQLQDATAVGALQSGTVPPTETIQ